MSGERVLLRRDRGSGNRVLNGQIRSVGAGGLLVHIDDLPKIPAVAAQRLMRRARAASYDDTVMVSELPLEYIEDEDQPVAPTSFSLHEDRLTLDWMCS
jgi:hypothetical protein